MVIFLKTMLWFSKEDDNSYSTQDKTVFLLADKNLCNEQPEMWCLHIT